MTEQLTDPQSKTRIIATIGPASRSKEVLRQLIQAGVDVCRMNLSHDNHEIHMQTIRAVRELNQELNTQVALLADLQGPKIRTGMMENDLVELKDGQTIEISTQDCLGTAKRISISYPDFARDAEAGEAILMDDGILKLEVTRVDSDTQVTARVVHGGPLSSRKGVNLPNTKVSLPSMTEKDHADAAFALENDIDWLALSFVRTAGDIKALKEIINKKGKNTRVIAKIEKPEAVKNIEDIVHTADGIMVARGDLGVEMSYDKVPLIQKEIVERSIHHSKPVIIATQMLESMIKNFRPTRAEANDVANAVLDGADALMLSGETSMGKYPVGTLVAMQQIISETENAAYRYNREHTPKGPDKDFQADSVCYHAYKMAQQAEAKAIITFTHSGYTATRIAGHRPCTPVFVFTDGQDIINKLSLIWGLRTSYMERYDNINTAIAKSIEVLKTEGHLKKGDIVVHTGSIPLKEQGRTNMVKLSEVK
jgi:pyruvate kinase